MFSSQIFYKLLCSRLIDIYKWLRSGLKLYKNLYVIISESLSFNKDSSYRVSLDVAGRVRM